MFANEVKTLKDNFKSGKTRSAGWRKTQLLALRRMLREAKKELCDAVYQDLHKNPAETDIMEIMGIHNEIVRMLGCIDEQVKPQKCSKSLLAILNTVHIRKEPLGVCLIIGAWNYPLLLSLQPMAGAIAAGNCILLKPSELTSATAGLLHKLIPLYLDPDCYKVVMAGPKESSDLINNHKFDLIFYTGGCHVGKLVMQAAAKTLTPVILELGGKNPCVVDKSCDLESAARRIAWGKWTNCGQICVAPDYILCEQHMVRPLIQKLKQFIEEYFGEDPRKSSSFCRIVNERHVKRLEGLLEGVDVVYGGVVDEKEKYISPTIVTNIKKDAPIRKEEIFGPILPIFTVEDVDDAIRVINNGEKSLQMSIFARDRRVINKIIAETSSGGVTVNELLMQHNEVELPFGGVGGSGMGMYHGKFSFDSFCHQRSYYECGTPEMINRLRYPPYTDWQHSILGFVGFKKGPVPAAVKFVFKLFLLAAFGALVSYFYGSM
uniref:aldehyde dehydrogenase family 3 member A2-like n=1 Tax=Styela clava TaxID=7725 RepID=UPI00193A1BE3|nr:aldehyde dehydrogenase family 3 member A2-like [Styela clava]